MQAKDITPFSVGNGDWRAANEWHVSVILNHYAGPDNVAKALRGEIPWTDPVFVKAIDDAEGLVPEGLVRQELLLVDRRPAGAAARQGRSRNGAERHVLVRQHGRRIQADRTGARRRAAAEPARRACPTRSTAVGSGSTMSINKDSANPDAACSFLDYLYSDEFYDRISKDWPGDWNLPLTSINEERLTKNVSPLFAATFARFAKGVAEGNYGYTTWTFWPPATEDYLIHGMEQVWLKQISHRRLPEEDADDLRPGIGGRQSAGNRPALNAIIRRGGPIRPFLMRSPSPALRLSDRLFVIA